MKVQGHNGVNQARLTIQQSSKRRPAIQRVRINPEVENYRLISGVYPNQTEFLEHVLNYSTSIPLSRRGISKVVFDSYQYLQARNSYSQGVSLIERLSREGVKIVFMDDILDFVEKQYPEILTTLKLFEQFKNPDNKDWRHDPSRKQLFEYYVDVILCLIPEYAFSTGKNSHLKTVTVIRNNFLSSLFLPSDAGNVEASAGSLIEGIEEFIDDNTSIPTFVVDGAVLSEFATKKARSTGLLYSPEHPNGFKLAAMPNFYLWTNSIDSAKELSRIVNQTITRYLDHRLLIHATESQLVEHQEDGSFYHESAKTLAEIVNDKDASKTVICHEHAISNPEGDSHISCWVNNFISFSIDLRLDFIVAINTKYLAPVFKKAASKCEVQYVDFLSSELPKEAERIIGLRNFLVFSQPSIGFFSDTVDKMACFTRRAFPDTSKSIQAKYYMEVMTITDRSEPTCVPVIKLSDTRRIITSANQMEELKKINTKVLESYLPQSGQFCRNFNPAQTNGQLNCNDYIVFNIVGGCAVAPIQAMAPGLMFGMTAGFADHIDSKVIRQHPVACALACVASSAVGYSSMGLLGVGLNLSCWVLQSRMPVKLNDRIGSTPFFLGWKAFHGVISMSPMLVGGAYHFIAGLTGFALGNLFTSSVAKRMFRDSTGSNEEQRSPPGERQKKRRRPKMKPVAASGSDVPREKDAANTDNCPLRNSAVSRQRMIRDMLAPSRELSWSLPGIELLVIDYAQQIEDRQERADYLAQRLAECEMATGGLQNAVSQFPDLYGQYLQVHEWYDFRRANSLWKVLTPSSSQEVWVQAGKMLAQDCLNYDDPLGALAVLDDPMLTSDATMKIINDLSGAQMLFRDEVPEKLARAYLAQVNLKERKQKTLNHICSAVTRWLEQLARKPDLTDNILHLAMDFRLADCHDEQTRLLFHKFRNALKQQASTEVRYLPDSNNKVQRYLRAGAVEIVLNESHH